MVLASLLNNKAFYHLGIVVLDFDGSLKELSATHGLEWARVQHRSFSIKQPNGIVQAEFRVTYSVQGKPHFEIIEATPGTIWSYSGGGIHHLGYWSDDLSARY